SVRVASGATLDLSGGGELLGAGFVSGRGGSTDARYNPLVRFDEEGRFDLPGLADNPISVRVASGATLDLSGGGELLGAGFVSGRGGSTDA
ncbi:hypothetical protein ACLXAZ_33365, partial [Escherichia coli]